MVDHQIGNPVRVAYRQLEAATEGRGRLFAFGDPEWPEFIAIAPADDGWKVKYGGYPLTAVDFSFGVIETERTEDDAYRLAMEVADNGDWAEIAPQLPG